MSRVPIRIRLTLSFALAMAVVLVAAAIYVYASLESDLTDSIDDGLETNASELLFSLGPAAGSVLDTGAAPAESDEGFAQVLARDGSVIEGFGGTGKQVLTDAELREALRDPVWIERQVAGIDGTTRILAGPIDEPGRPEVAAFAVGRSTEDRDETLDQVIASFGIGGLVAVFVVSVLGLVLARSALAPIEAIRHRAETVSLAPDEPLLPLPDARDEVRRLGETLNEMLARLRASFERERRFVADASHDLRSPIAVVRAELDAALGSGDLGPRSRESVVAAIEECDALAALAEDMLVLAQAEDGGLALHAETVAARIALEDVAARFERRAGERGRRITIDAPPEIETRADKLRLRQALGNLVENALRHGEGDVVLSARSTPGAVAFEVADAGPGFGPEIVPRAFDRFTTADAARSSRAGGRAGTGLGLAIVRAVAEAHGGTAEIVPGRGGKVRITLPNGSQGSLSDGA